MFNAMQGHLENLLALASRHADGAVEAAIPGIAITVARQKTQPTVGMFQPRFCLVLQGAKEVTIGDRCMRYDPTRYFIASLEVPATGCIIEADANHPYVGLSMVLDPEALAALLVETPASTDGDKASFAVSPVTAQLLDPCVRLMALLDTPRDIPVLAPMLKREILYRLLQGPQGGALRQIANADGRLGQVRRAIAWIREHFDQNLRVETLAAVAGMSTASFHRHFKAATAMSPLQYQKSIRLQQARLMLATKRDAARVGYAVGYESASQFSREYARQFGLPPARDALRLLSGAATADASA
ncbi:AraC family transcriptional regulator [Terricaulis silvestris]|uniref:L-rhamnose operon regulatory protein RhaS n=1 Tax=Terricaulis silvestris TaxID=2686094 RepID=A0A6I6MKS1_9CAUL|nr:AraC family transcriptional regulator [Terricaulis silvestris]QGZ93756.1 L-rhamnose operon regulatory protein RhaS [Terricaulis silvestris]